MYDYYFLFWTLLPHVISSSNNLQLPSDSSRYPELRGVLTLVTRQYQDTDDRMPNQKPVEVKQKLGPGECFHITPGTIHRFCAEKGDVVLAEVSTYFPDDVVRIEDDYKR